MFLYTFERVKPYKIPNETLQNHKKPYRPYKYNRFIFLLLYILYIFRY